eukprot:m51a1_g4206 hypothetical protein (545) ;mRNA; r:25862-27687
MSGSPPNYKKPAEVVEEVKSLGIFLDEEREAFALDTFRSLYAMVTVDRTNVLDGADNRFKRMLLGRRAVGKTFLLQHLQQAATRAWGIRNVYIDYSVAPKLPSDAIISRMSAEEKQSLEEIRTADPGLPAISAVSQVCSASSGPPFFVVIDEFQRAYAVANGGEMLQEFSAIGGFPLRGSIHCVITGSSKHTRELACTKMEDTPQNRSKFPRYWPPLNLNSTKFQPRWIFPLVESDVFLRFISLVPHAENVAQQPDLLRDILVRTGGYPGLVANALREGTVRQQYATKGHAPGDADLVNAFLSSLLRRVNLQGAEVRGDDDTPDNSLAKLDKWVTCVPLRTVVECIENEQSRSVIEKRNLWYKLADRGIIRMYDAREEPSIGFGTHYETSSDLQLRTQHAESVALRLFARAPDDRSAVAWRLWKEVVAGRDYMGGDACVVEFPATGDLVAHRLQLKLGKKLPTAEVEKVIARFKTHSEASLNAYKKAFNVSVVRQHWYLATTCSMLSQDRNKLSDNEIFVLDARFLSELGTWPPAVKALGKPYV